MIDWYVNKTWVQITSHKHMYYGVQLYPSQTALIVLWMLCTKCVVDVTGARLGGKSYTSGESKCEGCRGGRWMKRLMIRVVELLVNHVGVTTVECRRLPRIANHLPTSPLIWKPFCPGNPWVYSVGYSALYWSWIARGGGGKFPILWIPWNPRCW